MTKLLSKLKLWQKIALIIGSFALPVSILAFFTFQSFEENIALAKLEKSGVAFNRPLAALLQASQLINSCRSATMVGKSKWRPRFSRSRYESEANITKNATRPTSQ